MLQNYNVHLGTVVTCVSDEVSMLGVFLNSFAKMLSLRNAA